MYGCCQFHITTGRIYDSKTAAVVHRQYVFFVNELLLNSAVSQCSFALRNRKQVVEMEIRATPLERYINFFNVSPKLRDASGLVAQ